MIEFKSVYAQQIKAFYSVFNANFAIEKNTLFVGDAIDGSHSILRLIAKIEKEYKGEIFVDGNNIKQIKDKNLPIAYLPHNFALFENKTIFENLFYPLKIRKINKNEAKNIIFNEFLNYNLFFKKIFKKIEINEILNIKVKNLSYSQKKLISLLRATLRKPKYILIEDFFSNLDDELYDFSFKIILDALQSSTIIACENKDENLECYKSFERINLEKKPAD